MIGQVFKEPKGKPFKKYCIRCNKLFQPTSKFSRICDKCNKRGKNK